MTNQVLFSSVGMMPSGFAIFYCMVSAKLFSSTSVHLSQRLHLVTLATMLIHGCFFYPKHVPHRKHNSIGNHGKQGVKHRNSYIQQMFSHCVRHVGIIGDRGMKYRGGNLQCHDDHGML
jgi:hypothetical protein